MLPCQHMTSCFRCRDPDSVRRSIVETAVGEALARIPSFHPANAAMGHRPAVPHSAQHPMAHPEIKPENPMPWISGYSSALQRMHGLPDAPGILGSESSEPSGRAQKGQKNQKTAILESQVSELMREQYELRVQNESLKMLVQMNLNIPPQNLEAILKHRMMNNDGHHGPPPPLPPPPRRSR